MIQQFHSRVHETKAGYWRGVHTPTFTAASATAAKTRDTWVPVSGLTAEDVARSHSGASLSREKEDSLAICGNTVSEDTAKISQRQANTVQYHLYVGPKGKPDSERRG